MFKVTCVLVMLILVIAMAVSCSRPHKASPANAGGSHNINETGFVSDESGEDDGYGVFDELPPERYLTSPRTGETVIGFSLGGLPSDFLTAQVESLRSVFNADNGYEMTVLDAHNDGSKQTEDMEKLIDANMDYLFVMPLPDVDWATVLSNAKAAEKAVIFLGNVPEGTDESMYLCSIENDTEAEGKAAADWMAGRFGSEEPVSIGIIDVEEHALEGQGRIKGFLDAASAHSRWEICGSVNSGLTIEDGKEALAELNSVCPVSALDAVVCANDNIALGVSKKIYEILGEGAEAPAILSFGGVNAALQALADGE